MGQPQKPIAAEQQILSLGRVLQKLREADSVDVLIETTIAYLQEEFDYKLIWIALYDRVNHILSGKGGIIPASDTNFLQQRVVLSPGDLFEQVVIEQRPLGIPDLQVEHRVEGWQELAIKFQIQGTIILPIRYKQYCLGLVLLGSQHWGYLLAGEARARLLIVLGELGAALYQHQLDLQRQQTKRYDEPLLKLLENLNTLNNLDHRLKAVVVATHQFVCPTDTKIYWFEPQGRSFRCRVSNQLGKIGLNSTRQQPALGITVQELSDFYYALAVNQIVWIGESRSSLKSDFTVKLLERLQVRSLLAAPIMWQKDLLGFLAIESNQPRIWMETDKNFVQAAAGLISLVAPTDSIESTIKEIQQNAQLTSQVAQAIYSDDDLQETLKTSAKQVLERLAANRFLLLQYNPQQNNYQFLDQSQTQNYQPLTFALNALKEVDSQLLQRASTAVGIENLDEDLRFFNWRPSLVKNGVKSFLVCNCTQGHKPTALLVVTHQSQRSWTTLEKELLWAVSQQIGVIIHQWELQASNEQQEKILRGSQQYLRILAQGQKHKPEAGEMYLERTAIKQIASILGCPVALLLTWSPGQQRAEIIPGVITNSLFGVAIDASLSIQSEALIQWALATDGHLVLKVDDLPPGTRKWLYGTGIGQIFVMALRTYTDEQPTGVVVLADNREQSWSQQSLSAIATLIYQLAWSGRQQKITQIIESTTQELRQLNWYKHRRLEDIQRTTTLLIGQIHDLGIPTNELTKTRYDLLLRQLDKTNNSMTGLLKLEQWELDINWETIPIATLLKRSLERVETLLKQQKLWIGVHGLGQGIVDQQAPKSSSDLNGVQTSMVIVGDIAKIELVLHELLLAACQRSHSGGRIDIWCRRLDERTLDLSITDNGAIEPQLLKELNQHTPKDVLAPSILDQPPGLHLQICQNLMQQLRGELHFYQLPDNRVVSRLLLLLASN
ncbi:MAG: GAF domain-containing protein [Gloeotrichia echinulata DEX184]|nr:GAF domain-containing protein [Gloeotrichia echinulata DEX184]